MARMTRARIIGVSGASGGVGASCLVGAIGVRGLRRGLTCACVDLRRFGGGLDVVLGADHERALRWPDLTRARGRLDIAQLWQHLPRGDGLPVVSHDRDASLELDPEAVAAIVDGLASHCDLVVVDLPPSASSEFAAGVALLHEGLVVAGCGPSQLAAAGVHVRAVRDHELPWSLVQRVDRRAHASLPATVSEALGLPLAAVLPDDDRVVADLRRGRTPGARGPLAEAADAVLDSTLAPLRSIA